MRIGVLLGGRSAEREVSLRTGEAIYQALLTKGYDTVKIDVGLDVVEKIKAEGIDLAFLALHGPQGEDGTIQGLLEMLEIPYTGSGVLASATAMDKIATKKILAFEGLPTPGYYFMYHRDIQKYGLDKLMEDVLSKLSIPVVVKAPTQGSTIGISFVKQREDLKAAITDSLSYGRDVLIEEMLEGVEVTAAVLGNDEPEALPLIEITSATGVYDYQAKYTVGLSEHIIPPRLPEEMQRKLQELAVKTYLALGCRGLSRVDFIVSPQGQPYILEVNTIPGMTETSLFPDAARAAGIQFPELIEGLLKLAMEK